MHALNTDLLREMGEQNDKRAGGKSALDRLVRQIAIGQALGDQLLYEVHGPYVHVQCKPARPAMITRAIRRLSGSLCGVARLLPKRRTADMDVRLDNALLKDIGITRSEIEFAVGFADQRSR